MRLCACIIAILLTCPLIHSQEAQTAQKETQTKQQKSKAERPVSQEANLTIREPEADNKQPAPYDAGKDCLYRAYLIFTILGVIAGILGIAAIYTQTRATKEAAIATAAAADASARSAKATEDSVSLQEIALRQWLNLEQWEVWIDKRRGIFRVRFQVVNPTNLPLTLTAVGTVTHIREVADPCSESNPMSEVLAPNNPFIGDISVSLRDDQITKLLPADHEAINVLVGCVISFSNSTGEEWEQKFERAIVFDKEELFDLKEFTSLAPLVRQLSNHLRPKQT